MTADIKNIVIAGAGQAGATVALGLRRAGFEGGITLIGDESSAPYERPQLSKEMLLQSDRALRPIKAAEEYSAQSIDLVLGRKVVAVEPGARQVELCDGQRLPYDRLVIAAGVRPRPLPTDADAALPVVYLRTAEDAAALKAHLDGGGSLAIIGGGVIGLEVAAAASALGCKVCVIEAAAAVMSRSIDSVASDYLVRSHRARGIDIRLGVTVVSMDADGLQLSDGSRVDAGLVLAGIGVVPNLDGFRGLGIDDDAGILVDDSGKTAVDHIYATGDIASQPIDGRVGRVETWANAQNHAMKVVASLLGTAAPAEAPRWFWSDQGPVNVQVVGNACAGRAVLRGDSESDAFSVFRLGDQDEVIACTTINSPRDMAVARRWVTQKCRVDPARLTDISIALRDCTRS